MIKCRGIPINHLPVISMGGDLGTSRGDGEDTIDAKDVMLGEHIVGTDKVMYDANGPGALEVQPLTTPSDMSPAQWAKHCISHLPYHPGCSICRACKSQNSHHHKA